MMIAISCVGFAADLSAAPKDKVVLLSKSNNWAEQKLSLEQQKKLAVKLFKEIIKTNDYDVETIESLHKEIIARCPDTVQARISHWRLSNLYLVGFDKPDFLAIIELLESFMEKYPDSKLIPQVQNRLFRAYRETGASEKILSILKKILENPAISSKTYAQYGLLYGKELEKSGQKQAAKSIYKAIVEKADSNDKSYSVGIARNRLRR